MPLRALIADQEGAMTTAQAREAGLTPRQLRTLVAHGWTRLTQGVYVEPHPVDPFRASVRAALLACPQAIACGVTAARLHGLWGLPRWTPAERPHLLLPAGRTYNARTGICLHNGLQPGECVLLGPIPAIALERTATELARSLRAEDLVCLLDRALRLGWEPDAGSSRRTRRLRAALALTDARSESPLETLLRLLFVRAGLAPEALQHEVRDNAGRVLARLDMAWPSVRLAVEADGREYHDDPDALYRDRHRANDVVLEGWRILRFTWADVLRRPEWVVAQIRRAITG